MKYIPDNKQNLVAQTTLLLVLEIEDGIAAVVSGERLDELLI